MKKYTSNFWRLSFSMFFFVASFNLILPESNAIISKLGGEDLKGFVIALFTISAGLSRPFSGKLSDFIGRKKVMLIGVFICTVVSLVYPLCYSVWFFLILRFFHGFSAGFFPTGATALVSDLLSVKDRGAGMGIWGTFISLGIGFGQGLGGILLGFTNETGLFVSAAILAAISYALLLGTKETLSNPVPFSWKQLIIKKDEIIEKSVIPVAVVMFLSAMCSGIIFVLTPEISGYLKLENKGIFFIFYVISTIGVRLFTGRISDRFGRRETLIVGMSLICISMIFIGMSTTATWFILSSILFGVATGLSSPTIFAWTADRSPEHRRGIGAGTMFIAMEFGVLAGSLLTNYLYSNNLKSIWTVFLMGAIVSAISVLYLIWNLRYEKYTKIIQE